ncbi:MAG: serine/threonine protein kinase [Richelia sp. RM2_1_2]|nr:serine/threonine protein kinase [Richelia sp. RM2_1_2]
MYSPSNPDSWIGRLIDDNQRYRLDQRLGGGGMGDVFLATDTRVGTQVALKLLKETLITVDELKKRFEREVTISAALKNLHIVEVSDYGVTSQGHPFYVMEYLRGKTLGELIREKQRLSVEETVHIISQVCEGLRHAHQGVTVWRDGGTKSEHIQVVHRDLKPDNIFVVSTDKGNLVKILDFGIAKIRSDSFDQTNLTQTTAFLGTVRYSSPEQLRGSKEIDGRADIYSLGIIIYQMLSGNDPFGFSTEQRVSSESSWMLAHISDPPLSLRQQPSCEQLSPELEAVVMRCLEKQADARFASVEELSRALSNTVNPVVNNNREHLIEITIVQPQRQQFIKEVNQQNIDYQPRIEETGVQPRKEIQQPKEQEEDREENLTKNPRLPLKFIPIIIAGIGVVGIGIFFYYFNESLQSLKKIESLSNNGNFAGCITEAQKVPQNSSDYSKSQEYLQECINKAVEKIELLYNEANLEGCIEEAKKIPQDIPNYSRVEKFLKECEAI